MKSRRDVKSCFKLLGRVANIAERSRTRHYHAVEDVSFDVYQRLYQSTPMFGDALAPATLFNPANPVDDETFPTFVTVYLRPSEWSRIITDQTESGPVLLIKQIPGDEEYRALSLFFHPDRQPRHSRFGGLNRTENEFVIKPDGTMSTLLNAAYDLWKDTTRSSLLVQEPYNSMVDDDDEFAQRSRSHADGLRLFSIWFRIYNNAKAAMVPSNVSFAEIHHYVNTQPQREEPLIDAPEFSSQSDDDDEFAEMNEMGLIFHAQHLAQRKRGRPRKKAASEDEDSEDENSNESGDGETGESGDERQS